MVAASLASVPSMILVGLTGGIGSGKSTVSLALAKLGAVIIDADLTTRRLQEPGAPVFNAIVERFGDGIVAADGTLDRLGLAGIVFPDPDALADLNQIVHPVVGLAIRDQVREHILTDAVVVLDVPLLIENNRYPVAGIVVVDTPTEIAIHRLVLFRNMDQADAEARIARQASREERRDRADFIVDNSGTHEQLLAQVPALWTWMSTLAPVAPDDDRLVEK